MTTLREAAQQALEALDAFLSDELRPYEAAKTAAALKAALAEPVQEPVAFALKFNDDSRLCLSTVFDTIDEAQEQAALCPSGPKVVPLYTATPQPLNLHDPAVQKRLTAQWGYVKAVNDA